MIDPTDAASTAGEAVREATRRLGDVDAVRRALSVENTGRYKLGAGGRDPSAPTPLDAAGLCDCSGFLAWAWSEPRRDSADGEDEIDGDWLNTTALYLDARGPQRFVREIAAPHVLPGDALVYRGGLPDQPVGHIGIVVARPAIVTRFADVEVIHCHSGKPPAIERATGRIWESHGGIGIRRVA